jgi:hypothetical protein
LIGSRCHSPLELTRVQTGGIWSRDEVNNPFAKYFKVSYNNKTPATTTKQQQKKKKNSKKNTKKQQQY